MLELMPERIYTTRLHKSFKGLRSVRFVLLLFSNDPLPLIKSDIKDIYNVTKMFYFR